LENLLCLTALFLTYTICQEVDGSRSQDYKYREFDGIVAATDGSVIDDPDEGPCMGGGLVFVQVIMV
jgi:hypothetical protein